ncbi:MAG: hypothetical protein R2780_01570 [Crocinitomicaceae bacterium]|nr:hypothetical protein [Crocinitomicaceae bacterium]
MGRERFEIVKNLDGFETLRLNEHEIELGIQVYSGKSQGYFVWYAPSIEVSGYGTTAKEAQESFKHNLDVFSEDILNLTSKNRELALFKLGWSKKNRSKKQFSKSYIDKDGVLHNFDPETEVETAFLEVA